MLKPWKAPLLALFQDLLCPGRRRKASLALAGIWVSAMSLAAAVPASYPGAREGANGWVLSGSLLARSASEKPRLDVQEGFYCLATLSGDSLESALKGAPRAGLNGLGKSGTVISLPMPNGVFSRFYVEESPVMEAGLAAQFPQIQTYRGRGIDDPEATLRCDLTPEGFHGQVLSSLGTVYIDPSKAGDRTSYISYDKQGLQRSSAFTCLVDDTHRAAYGSQGLGRPLGRLGSSDGFQRTYRLALACTGEYAAAVCAHNGVEVTVANTLSAMVTSVARVNGVYERELGIHLNLVASNASLIYLDSSTDPYENDNGENLLGQNQTKCDTVIGSANYDIGHVFSTGGGGVAYRGAVCGAFKAGGVTGSSTPYGDAYDIDYVAHEMGHQFGANHTFISQSGSCGSGNRNAATAYELGSGVTIMAYAGICSPDDLGLHSYDYFHTISLDEITTYISTVSCSQNTVTGNHLPVLGIGPDYADVPVNTPFTLTALAATDADGDSLTYSWDDWQTLANCLFRPQPLSANPSRTFPQMADLLSGAAHPWETLPTVPGTRTFRCTVRDNHPGAGAFVSDTLTVTFVANAFSVSAPSTALSWVGRSSQAVTWIKGGSISANVKISLSTDGGLTWKTLVASTPNDGSEQITVPNTASAHCRIKVEPTDNIYFALSAVDFTITAVPNAFPTLSSIGNQGLFQHVSSAPIPFTVGDPETPAASLSLSATSSNPTLLPVSGIVLGGSGANRTVVLTSAANQVGSSTVEITVQDGDGGTASQTFRVDVTNRVPVALAQDITITAPTQLVNASNASVDNGSSDPDGNPVTLSQVPVGPYPAGITPVTLTVTDSLGAHAQATANITVTQTPTTVTLSSSGGALRGETVTLTARASSLFGTPGGTITFLDGTTPLETRSLSAGAATLMISSLGVGNHSLSVQYGGSTYMAGATSSVLGQSISPISTTTVLSGSGTTRAGENISLSAAVSSSYGAPTGTVTFLDGATLLGTAALSNGAAILITSNLPAGTHRLTARYEGATNWTGSSSSALSQEVAPAVLVMNGALTPMTLIAGASGTVPLQVSQLGVLSGPVTFAVTGMPEGVSCTFSPNEVPVVQLPATIQMKVQTTRGFPLLGAAKPVQGLGGGAFLVCGFLLVPLSRRRKHGMLFLSGFVVVMMGGLLACGGGSRTSSGLNIGKDKTPTGTYTLTITATASQADAVNTTLQLTVTH